MALQLAQVSMPNSTRVGWPLPVMGSDGDPAGARAGPPNQRYSPKPASTTKARGISQRYSGSIAP